MAGAVGLVLGACSSFGESPSYVSYAGQTGRVASIEMLWENGQGMGAFVDTTQPVSGPERRNLSYRITVLYGSGERVGVVQDGSERIELGELVTVRFGRVTGSDGQAKAPTNLTTPRASF